MIMAVQDLPASEEAVPQVHRALDSAGLASTPFQTMSV